MEEAPAADALAGRRCGVLDAEGGRRVGGGRRGCDAGAREAEYARASDASRRGNPRARGPENARRDGCGHREKCLDPAGLPLAKLVTSIESTTEVDRGLVGFHPIMRFRFTRQTVAEGGRIMCYFAEFGRSLTRPTAGKLQDFPRSRSGVKIRDPERSPFQSEPCEQNRFVLVSSPAMFVIEFSLWGLS